MIFCDDCNRQMYYGDDQNIFRDPEDAGSKGCELGWSGKGDKWVCDECVDNYPEDHF